MAVTALYAGLMGLWMMLLSFEVMRRRRRHDVSVGDAGVPALEQAVRAHGNACENIPIALILMGLGLMLVVGRLHGWYFLTGASRLNIRIAGMLLTVGMIGALSLGVVFHALARLL